MRRAPCEARTALRVNGDVRRQRQIDAEDADEVGDLPSLPR